MMKGTLLWLLLCELPLRSGGLVQGGKQLLWFGVGTSLPKLALGFNCQSYASERWQGHGEVLDHGNSATLKGLMQLSQE